ncbi:MAG: response regulator, partial [Roseateles sp.]
AQRFDLVLMDVQMPGMDGLTATRQWRAIEAAEGLPRTPIVALTANAFDADARDSLQAGCDAHLTKPLSLAALLQALARHARD